MPNDSEAMSDHDHHGRGAPKVLAIADAYGHEPLRYVPATVTDEPIEWEPPETDATIRHIPLERDLIELWDRHGSFREAFLEWSDRVLTLAAWREYGWLEPADLGGQNIYPARFSAWLVEQRWMGRTHAEIRAHASQAWPCLPLPSSKSGLSHLIGRELDRQGGQRPSRQGTPGSYERVEFVDEAKGWARDHYGRLPNAELVEVVFVRWGHPVLGRPARRGSESAMEFWARQDAWIKDRLL